MQDFMGTCPSIGEMWPPHLMWVFMLSNGMIALHYASLGMRHFKSYDGTMAHVCYGSFITSCGLGHLFMVKHMISFSPTGMAITHGFTAVVSIWMEFVRCQATETENREK